MNDKKVWIVVRCMYVFYLLFACYMMYGFFMDLQFARGDLHRWQDATAIVTESDVTNETLVLNSERDNMRDRRRFYKSYTVRYVYTAEFSAWDKTFVYEYNGSNSGETDRNAEKIPESAYIFPKQGDTVSVIFNPDDEGSYRIGSKEEWSKKGEISVVNLIVPSVLCAVAAIMIIIDILSARKRRIAANKADSAVH